MTEQLRDELLARLDEIDPHLDAQANIAELCSLIRHWLMATQTVEGRP